MGPSARRALGAVLGLAVVAAVVVVVVLWRHQQSGPPELVSGSGNYRVHVSEHAGQGNAESPPTMTVHGERVLVQTTGVRGGSRPTASLYVRVGWPPPETGRLPSRTGTYTVGDHIDVEDIRVTVLAIWDEADNGKDAVDLHVVHRARR